MSRSSLNAVNMKPPKSRGRATYHHGDLRAALIRAAEEIIVQEGIEGFSLRAAAQRAGVSQSALVDRAHPRFEETRLKPGTRFDAAIAAHHGRATMDLDRFEDAADFFGAIATVHGLAHLVLAEKGTHLFEHGDTRSFVEKDLPKVLERMYPSKTPGANRKKRTPGR